MGEEKKSNYILFYEVQTFSSRFIVYHIINCIAIFYFFRSPILEMNPFGILVLMFLLTFAICTAFYLFSYKLITEVHQDGIYYRRTYRDKSFKKISFNEVRNYWARGFSLSSKYSNIKRRMLEPHERIYIMSDKKGIQFELRNENELLISTQKPEEFIRATDSALGK